MSNTKLINMFNLNTTQLIVLSKTESSFYLSFTLFGRTELEMLSVLIKKCVYIHIYNIVYRNHIVNGIFCLHTKFSKDLKTKLAILLT